MVITLPGIKYPIEVATVAQYEQIGDDISKQTVRAMFLGGGAAACYMSKENIKDVINNPSLDEIWKKDLRKNAEKDLMFISVLYDAIAHLTEAEQTAILLHEEAHIEYGDIHGGKVGFLNDDDAELRADAYAADRIGKEVLKSALEKCFAHIEIKNREFNQCELPEAVTKLMHRRFDALAS